MPASCGGRPVSRAERLGEHVGAAEKAWRNSTPSSAKVAKAGVSTACPYGDTWRPVSWLLR